MAALPETHDCEWRGEAERLKGELIAAQDRLGTIEQQLEKLQRHVFGKRSEKMPSVADELRRFNGAPSREQTLNRRRENRQRKAELPEREIKHEVPANERRCPKCGKTDLKKVGAGKKTVVYEYVPGHFEKQVHLQETLACTCGECLVVAAAPARPIEGGQYGPGLIAHIVTSKCADSMPLYRLAGAYQREGIPIARTTLGDLFHAAARELTPLWDRLLALIAQRRLVLADETPIRVLDKGKTRKGYLWTFRTARGSGENELIGYCFSPTRSGDTPKKVLGGTQGYLMVDGYTGYNRVTLPEGRTRLGCWAHARRDVFDSLKTSPEAQELLDLIRDLYRVEHEAKASGILGTEAHSELRRERSSKIIQDIERWLAEQKKMHPPKSPLGEAISYIEGQWPALTRFLENARLPLDNNASEGALRVPVLGRKNFLFVGHDEGGERLAGLYSLVATCKANGVNPQAYLADVLVRMKSHPAKNLDDLLPHRWATAVADSS
ncbi:MAG: IS66 family transposase [Gemmatimonadales bacterium]|nr:IS66 family transposase [Gemmatimonadales bacterium]